MQNLNPYEIDSFGVRYRPLCSGWKIFPDGKKCKGCKDCSNSEIMATKTKTPAKKKAPAKKKSAGSAKKLCRKIIKQEGVNSKGQLKPGYKYAKGGRVVKAKAKK